MHPPLAQIGSKHISEDDYIQCGDILFKTCIRSTAEELQNEPTSAIIRYHLNKRLLQLKYILPKQNFHPCFMILT